MIIFLCMIAGAQLVFKTSDITKGWDGKVNGQLQNNGTFVWIVNAEGFDGKQFQLKGDNDDHKIGQAPACSDFQDTSYLVSVHSAYWQFLFGDPNKFMIV